MSRAEISSPFAPIRVRSWPNARPEGSTMAEGKKSVVLSGVTAGRTAICTVGREGKGLHYRGYDIRELAEQSNYNDVAYMLLYGELPNRLQSDSFRGRIIADRAFPV